VLLCQIEFRLFFVCIIVLFQLKLVSFTVKSDLILSRKHKNRIDIVGNISAELKQIYLIIQT